MCSIVWFTWHTEFLFQSFLTSFPKFLQNFLSQPCCSVLHTAFMLHSICSVCLPGRQQMLKSLGKATTNYSAMKAKSTVTFLDIRSNKYKAPCHCCFEHDATEPASSVIHSTGSACTHEYLETHAGSLQSSVQAGSLRNVRTICLLINGITRKTEHVFTCPTLALTSWSAAKIQKNPAPDTGSVWFAVQMLSQTHCPDTPDKLYVSNSN